VDVQRQPGFRHLHHDAAPLRQVFRLGRLTVAEHRVRQRAEVFAERDVIDKRVAVEHPHLRDARQQLIPAARRRDAEHADVQPALPCPLPVALQHVVFAARAAERGEP
jgi:hypothetical protein